MTTVSASLCINIGSLKSWQPEAQYAYAPDNLRLQRNPGHQAERIEAAVEADGKHVAESYEGGIAADAFRGDVGVLITGPQGFERSVVFGIDEDAVAIAQLVRDTIDE